MFRWKAFAVVIAAFIGSSLPAQTAARPTDPVFVRAQALVSDGSGAAGRALIDSMIAATPLSAPLYPQALFWRASLAASAADAERDYKHIVVDYPLTSQAPEALLRLAQLELARGDRDAALGHLQRIPRDYPSSKSLARAHYWIARVFFEKGDLVNGCAANASAVAQLDVSEVELRNQIQYQGQRCPVATAAAVSQSQPAVVDSALPSVEKTVELKRPAPLAAATDAKPGSADPARPVVVDSTRAAVVESADVALTKGAAVNAGKPEFSLQVAAYKTQPEAENLAAGLRKRGYEARVDVSPDWFRVRIGRYPSKAAAQDQLRAIRSQQMSGFVVQAPNR